MSSRITIKKQFSGKFVLSAPGGYKSKPISLTTARAAAIDLAQQELAMGTVDVEIHDEKGRIYYDIDSFTKSFDQGKSNEKYADDLNRWVRDSIEQSLSSQLGSRIAKSIGASAGDAAAKQYLKIAKQ